MKNSSKLFAWFGGSVIWSALFISLAAYSAEKALEQDPKIEEKLSQNLSEKWGTNVNVSVGGSQAKTKTKNDWAFDHSNQKINIELITADIELKTVRNLSQIKISARGKLDTQKAPELLEITNTGELLTIRQPNDNASSDLDIIIEVPQSYNGKLNVEAISGDVSINQLNPNEIILKTISGDISFKEIKSENIKLKTVSGDFDLNNVLAQNLDVNTTSGDVEIEFRNPQKDIKFDIQTVSGTVKNRITNFETENRSYNIKTISGDIEIH